MSNDLSSRGASGAKADRDHILEQALKQELRAGTPPLSPQCLDAETLAAWEGGGLDAAAMAAAEIHVSTCARCQSVLAAIAKGMPATMPAAESKRFLSWHWWFAPIAATAAAATLWMVVPEQQQPATSPPSAVAPARDADLKEQAKADAPAQPSRQNAAPAVAHDALKDRASAPAERFAEREDRRERQAAPGAIKEEEAGKLMARESAPAVATVDAASATGATNAAPPPAAPAPALRKSA
ncbi:MAG: hypothetical protein ABI039_04890, partial [Vicinamibacterales bacterium]